ncbi:MAG: PilZ domain-containing protein [Methylovulum sp.]|nr:PilZ domain-containing protein [Methylovulum sp.]MDD2722503.1 PilZ domain-containing protein [Methylovulum sp.]MDD5125724.1 PilZ domain-containing protein [Methylovulum sp.]
MFIDSRKYSGKISNISLGGAFLSEADPETLPIHNARSGVLKTYLGDGLLLLKCEVVYAVAHDNEFFLAGAGVAFDEEDNETNKSIIKLGLAYNLCWKSMMIVACCCTASPPIFLAAIICFIKTAQNHFYQPR